MRMLAVFFFVLSSFLASFSAWGASPSIERCATLGVAPGARTPSVFPVEGCPSVRPLPQSEKKVPASSIDRGDVKNALRSFFTVVVPSSLSSWAQGIEEEGTQRYALNAVRSYGDSAVQGLVSSLVEGLKASSPVFAHLEASYDYTFGSSASSWGAHVSGVFPLWRTKTNLLFSEINVLYKDKRPTLNIGIGDRYLLGKSVLVGGNAFYDEEFKDKNKRFSVGLEAGTLYLKGSANYYRRLSGWTHSSLSPAGTFYQERTANGYDVRLKGLLPFYPQVGLTARYFQWYGLHINLFAQNDVKQGSDDPRGIAVGVVYHPNQIFNVGVEYTKGLKNKQHATRVNAGVNFLFGVPMKEQFAFSAPTLDLASQLFDPVNRENEIILEKRKKGHINLQSEYAIDVGGAPFSAFHAAQTVLIRPDVKEIKGALAWDFTLGSEFFKLARSKLQATFKVTDATQFGEHYRFRVSGQDIYGNPLSSSSFVVLKHIPFDSDGVILEVSKVQKQNATSFKIGVTAHEGDGRYTLDSTYGTKGLKVVRGGTSVTAWTLKPLTTGPITAGVKKEYTVTVPSPGLKGGATYTLSVRLVDGDGQKAQSADQSFKVTTTPMHPAARFASRRYVQPEGAHFVVEPTFQGLPQQGARPSWSLEKWKGTMWVKQPMWQTVHSADRDDVVKKDGPKTYTFRVNTSSPGEVDRVTLTLTPAVAAPAQLLSTSRGTSSTGGHTLVVFVKGGSATHTGAIDDLQATLHSKDGKGSEYHFTLKPSGGTEKYKVIEWVLRKGSTDVDKTTYTMTGGPLKPDIETNYTLRFKTPPSMGEQYHLRVTLTPDLKAQFLHKDDKVTSKDASFTTISSTDFGASFENPTLLEVTKNKDKVFNLTLKLSGGTQHYLLSKWRAEQKAPSSSHWTSFTWPGLPASTTPLGVGTHLFHLAIPGTVKLNYQYRVRVNVQQVDAASSLIGPSITATSRTFHVRPLGVTLAVTSPLSLSKGETLRFTVTPRGGNANTPYKAEFKLKDDKITPPSPDTKPLAPGMTKTYTYMIPQGASLGPQSLKVILTNEGLAVQDQKTIHIVNHPTIALSVTNSGSGGSMDVTAGQQKQLWYYIDRHGNSVNEAKFNVIMTKGTSSTTLISNKTTTKFKTWVSLNVTLPSTTTQGTYEVKVEPLTPDLHAEGTITAQVAAHLAWTFFPTSAFNIPDNVTVPHQQPTQSFSMHILGGKAPYTLSATSLTQDLSCLPNLSQNEKKFEVTCAYNAPIPAGTNKAGQVALQVTDANGATTQEEAINLKAWGVPKIDPHLIVKALVPPATGEYDPDIKQTPHLWAGAYIIRLHDALKVTAKTAQGYSPSYHWTWNGSGLPGTGNTVTKTLNTATLSGGHPSIMSVQAQDGWGRESATSTTVKVVVVSQQLFSRTYASLIMMDDHAHKCSSGANLQLTFIANYKEGTALSGVMTSPSEARGCLEFEAYVSAAVGGDLYLLKDKDGGTSPTPIVGGVTASSGGARWEYKPNDPGTDAVYQKNGETVYWTLFRVSKFYHNKLLDIYPKEINSSHTLGQFCLAVRGTTGSTPALCGNSTKTYSESEVRRAFSSILTPP